MGKEKSSFKSKTKRNSIEGMGIQTEVDPEHPLETVDRYTGDSVNEHKVMEEANEFIADKEIEQVDNNS
ncbi:hypothetical protein [Aquibacillus albus]|uniref:DUF4025 domain-containing protein n=1 Tax=Aquibacillus albus TaxID=1168171 RepID=A0ABS2MZ72_9BACI|nr:hypothetical protein [Aquibacillus albus]MBM7571213.1 hypothetical protein [Aquibacillus albus]